MVIRKDFWVEFLHQVILFSYEGAHTPVLWEFDTSEVLDVLTSVGLVLSF